MDILGMLENDLDDLCEEDLEIIKQELEIGDYDYSYREQCYFYIDKARHYFEEKKREKVYIGNRTVSKDFIKENKDVIGAEPKSDPKKETKSNPKEEEKVSENANKSQAELFQEKIVSIRRKKNPHFEFIKYIDENASVTNEFIDNNFKIFNQAERNILISNRKFDEKFLDKYFDVLDKKLIATKQLFSEEFFMKHYADLPTKAVLSESKNLWKEKENRSSKLSTFLRLKGVKL